ncbi:MAG: 1-aminocyclopropane-1-carboxylate deaminase/D-cysteine desulfhydrase [Longimicrobiales bacterium]
MSTAALFARHPQLGGSIPWLPLGCFPTPVHTLDLAGFGAGDVWIKRDDLSGEVYGGNKVRKLEFLLGDAERSGATRLATIGAAGSHHALATTVYGSAAGFDVSLILFPQPPTPHARRVLATDAALGADVIWATSPRRVPAVVLRARWALRRERVAWIPVGGSSPLGTLGYVSGGLELADQIREGVAPAPREIHVPGGTLGTAAGIALGLALAGVGSRIIVTRVVSRAVTNRRRLLALLGRTARLLDRAGLDGQAARAAERARRSLELCERQFGRGYGHATTAGLAASDSFGACGVHLEPTYTAKAAAELLARRASARAPILFWHTFSSVHPLAARRPALDRLPAGARAYLEDAA